MRRTRARAASPAPPLRASPGGRRARSAYGVRRIRPRRPEALVLRNRDEHATARLHGTDDPADRGPIVVDVLDHVEGRNDINAACKSAVRMSAWSNGTPGSLRRATPSPSAKSSVRDGETRVPHVELRENEAGAAADLEKAPCVREVPAKRPGEEPVAATEPEAPRLELGQLLEKLRHIVRAARGQLVPDKRDDLGPRLKVAPRAQPPLRCDTTRDAGSLDGHPNVASDGLSVAEGMRLVSSTMAPRGRCARDHGPDRLPVSLRTKNDAPA